ncbi:MAG: hypothetical protein ACYDHT_10265 [Solirubrobacteraceae bacterium]
MSIGKYRITPAGLVVALVIVAGVLLAQFGPSSVQAPAFVVAVLLALALVVDGMSGRRTPQNKSLRRRSEEFPARARREVGDDDDAARWQTEQGRYRDKGR